MRWTIDPTHSHIQFAVKHMAISTVRGAFEKFTGNIEAEEGGKVSSAEVNVDVASVNTGAQQRDEHLRGEDFFSTGEFPQAHFSLTEFSTDGEDAVAKGELTIRGVRNPITLKGEVNGPAKDPWGNQRISAALGTKISRKEWGLVWNSTLETGGLLVGDDVKLQIDIEAVADKDSDPN